MANTNDNSETKRQDYANHKRTDPPYFYFFAPCIFVGAICAVVGLIREPGWTAAGLLILNVGTMGVFLRARTYPLTVQDRVVRLEMQLRLERILPEDLKPRVSELTLGQLIALRFASDAEMPELVRAVLEEGLGKGDEIKRRVKDWQPDFQRV